MGFFSLSGVAQGLPPSAEIVGYLFSTTGLLLSVCLVLLTAMVLSFHGSLLSGPGPWGLPIVGYYPFIRKDLHIQLHEMAKKYGPVYKINVFGQTFVYMESMKAVRESHITKSEYFPHRHDKYSVINYALWDGLVVVKGDRWKVLRKFFNQSMRDVGLSASKEQLHGPLEDAVKSVLDSLSGSKGSPVDLMALICEQATKAVTRLFLGDNVTESDIKELTDNYFDIFTPFVGANIMLAGNIAKFILPWIREYDKLCKGVAKMNRVLHNLVRQHKLTLNPSEEPTNVLDAYLREKALREKKGDPTASYFTDQSLVSTLIQAYGDGSTGIGLFVAAYTYELSKHREVQDAIYQEIVSVVGTERLPNLEDRSKMPYISAVMKEMLRVATVFPIFPGLECIKETTVQGVKVPEGSIVLLNYWATHNDPETYENPETFDVNRYLSNKTKVDPPIAFGVGKRSCAGERLVMTELFLFLTSIFQNFVLVPEDKNLDIATLFHENEGKCMVRVEPRSK